MKSLITHKNNVELISSIIILVALIAALLTMARVGLLSRYQTDDYCNIGNLKAYGYFQSIAERYNGWDGRYSFGVVIYFFSSLGEKFPSILPMALISLCYLSAFYFFRKVNASVFLQSTNLPSLVLGGFFTFLLIYTIPSVGQDVFWMTGSSTYFLPISLDLLFFGTVIGNSTRLQTFSLKKRVLSCVMFFLVSFFLCGFSEVITTLNISIIGMVLVAQLRLIVWKKKNIKQSTLWIISFLGALIGLLVMILAPGNQARESVSPAHPELIDLFSNALIMSGRFTFKWFFHYSDILWPTSVILFLSGVAFRNEFKLVFGTKETSWQLIGFVLVSLLSVFITFVPAYWALSGYPEDRVLIIPTAVLSFFMVGFPFLLGSYIQKGLRIEHSEVGFLNLTIILMILFYAVSSPIYQARKFYFQTYPLWQRFAERWDNQHASILESINQGERKILTEKIKVDTIGLEEFTSSPDFWVNTCAALYYGVDEISTLH